jgi:hypothetical protein
MVGTVTVAGYTPEAILDIEESKDSGQDLSRATITVGNTANNRDTIKSGDDVVITRGGNVTFAGYVTGLPSDTSEGTINIECMESRLELKHESVHQVFYELESSEAVRRIVDKRARALGLQEVHVGSNTDNWESNAPVFETYGGGRAGLYDWGTDLIFVGARSGHTGTLTARYENVQSGEIQDGIFELRSRLLVNDPGGIFDLEIELVTPGGTHYVWDPDLSDSGFNNYKLKAQEATSEGSRVSGSGKLEYRFIPDGSLAENTGIFIDNAHTIPFRLRDRPSAIDAAFIDPTGRDITRRVDQSAGEFIAELATEDQYDWWVDENDDLHYETAGGSTRPEFSIDDNAPVVGASFDRNFESIRNVVTVQGAGDIEETVRDLGSIEFYGVNPREEPIVDKTIQSTDEAEARAEGYLAEHAWNDTLATFEIADGSYSQLTPGDSIPVDWPTQNLNETYTVSDLSINKESVVSITISASSG